MAKRAASLEKAIEKRVTDIATSILTEVVNATPVRTGKARVNWQADVREPTSVLSAPASPSSASSDAIAAGQAKIAAFKIGGTLFIANNVDYIGLLDNGYSRQAPINFVRTAISVAVASQNGTVLIK